MVPWCSKRTNREWRAMFARLCNQGAKRHLFKLQQLLLVGGQQHLDGNILHPTPQRLVHLHNGIDHAAQVTEM